MGAISGAATPAASSAAAAAATAADAVNQPVADGIASPIWPGAVNPVQYAEPGLLTRAQSISGPGLPGQQFAEPPPLPEGGAGGYQDTSWITGHDAPQAPWDSLAGPPFAPSGAIAAADTHGQDTGAVFTHEHVTPPDIGQLTRRTLPGQTMNEVFRFDPVTGERLSVPNGRTNSDQYQEANCDAYDPVTVGYAERPVYNNLAYEAAAYTGPGVYSPGGQLPDLSPYGYAAAAYQAPPDPAVNVIAPAAAGGIGGGWVL